MLFKSKRVLKVSVFLSICSVSIFTFQNCTKFQSSHEHSHGAIVRDVFSILDAATNKPVYINSKDENGSMKPFNSPGNLPRTWANKTIKWSYNANGQPHNTGMNTDTIIAALIESTKKWESVCGIKFVYEDITDHPVAFGVCDSRNVVGWSNGYQEGVGGMAQICASGSSITELDLHLVPRAINSIDSLIKVAQHEFGHVLGLGDRGFDDFDRQLNYTNDAVVMWGWLNLNLGLKPLHQDDINLCQQLYGVSENVPQQQAPARWSTDYWGTGGDIPLVGKFHSQSADSLLVFRPSNGIHHVRLPGDHAGLGAIYFHYGLASDIPFVFDSPGSLSRIAMYREGMWYVSSSGANTEYIHFGMSGDIPVPGKYGSDKTLAAVYRPSDGNLYIRDSDTSHRSLKLVGVPSGASSDQFTALGTDSIAVCHQGSCNSYSANGTSSSLGAGTKVVMIGDSPVVFSSSGDKAYFGGEQFGSPGDYPFGILHNGSHRISVFRPSQGAWYIRNDVQ